MIGLDSYLFFLSWRLCSNELRRVDSGLDDTFRFKKKFKKKTTIKTNRIIIKTFANKQKISMSYSQQSYEQYESVLKSGLLSLDALGRIIRHDKGCEWAKSPESLARIAVFNDCKSGKLEYKKLNDEKGDLLFGNDWPLPPEFARVK